MSHDHSSLSGNFRDTSVFDLSQSLIIFNTFFFEKTIGYSVKPTTKNEDGLIVLVLKQKETAVRSNQKNITDTLLKIFNSDQSLAINVESIKPIDEEKTEVRVF
jgi:hypothetical protein